MHILIAPNAFKHSLNAPEVALAIQNGLLQSRLDCICTCFPIGDGGDGTGSLMVDHRRGKRVPATVADPFGRPIASSFGLVDEGQTAIIEMADASGLRLLPPHELNPLRATSFGTGELIRRALDAGATRFVLAVGGSATVDGGTGILRALGVRFLDATGAELTTPDQLTALARVDTAGLDPRLLTSDLTILCDVDNTLVGPAGAAAVFGPQKGATPAHVQRLDAGLARLAEVARQQTGVDMAAVRHGGAAGGVAAGLHTFLRASLVNGIDFFLTFTGFDRFLEKTDLVITGEGSIDEQTLHGKGPYGVAFRAKQQQLPVVGLAGRIPLHPSEALGQYFDTLLAIGHEPTDLPAAFLHTETNLTRTARQLGNLLATHGPVSSP